MEDPRIRRKSLPGISPQLVLNADITPAGKPQPRFFVCPLFQRGKGLDESGQLFLTGLSEVLMDRIGRGKERVFFEIAHREVVRSNAIAIARWRGFFQSIGQQPVPQGLGGWIVRDLVFKIQGA